MSYGGKIKERSQLEEVVTEVVPEAHSPEALRVAFKDNPTPRPEELRFIAENSRIHRRFIRDIMGENNGRKADLVVFTGSTYDVAADPLSVAGYLEGYKPEDLPDFASWNTMRYGDRHTAAPNSLVYKFVGRSAVTEAGNTLALASVLETQAEKWQSYVDEILQDEAQAIAHINQLAAEGRTISPKDQYVFGKIASAFMDRGIFGKVPGEYHPDINAMEGLVRDAEAVLKHYGSEIQTLQETVRGITADMNSGAIPQAEAYIQPDSFKVPQDERRVALLKALYPEYVNSLFNEDGTPKEIVFYDNVSISGEKTSAYLRFFEHLGIADHVRVYIMYTKPGARYEFPVTQTQVQVGQEITENFVIRSVDKAEDAQFMGREHDRKTRYNVPQINEYKSTEAEIAENRKKQVLVLAEQLLLPEQLDQVVTTMTRWVERSAKDRQSYDRNMLNFLDSGELFPRIITPSYTDFAPGEYADFEKRMGWEISEEKKEYFQVARQALEYMSVQFEQSGQEKMRVLLLDSGLHLIVEGFLRTPKFAHLKGKIIYEETYSLGDNINKVKDTLDPAFTVCIGNSFPTYQTSHLRKITEGGLAIDSVVLIGDGRREYTAEKRLAGLQEFQSRLADQVHSHEAKLQNAQAYTEQEQSQALRARIEKANNFFTISDYKLDELRQVFNSGVDVLHDDFRAANEKFQEYGLTDAFFESQEYQACEKHVLDIIRWQTQIYERTVEQLELLAEWPKDADLQKWGEALTLFDVMSADVNTLKILNDFLRSQRIGINYGETKWGAPRTNIFEVMEEFPYIEYDLERFRETIQKHLTAKYTEEYLPEDYPNLHVQSPIDTFGFTGSRVYDTDLKDRDKLVSKSVEAAKSVEVFRYLSEVVAFEE